MRRFYLVAMVALALQGRAMAGDLLSYSMIDAGYGWGELDDGGQPYNGKGWHLDGSVEITSHLFAFAGMHGASGKTWQLKFLCDLAESCEEYDPIDHATQKGHHFGLGLNWPLRPDLDLVSRASWNHLNRWYGFGTSFGNSAIGRVVDVSGDGAGFELGLRGIKGRRMAWQAAVKATRLNADFDGHGSPAQYTGHSTLWSGSYGLRVQVTPGYGVGGGVSVTSSGAAEFRLQFGLRIQFEDWDGPPG